jgi:Rrf2 family protein
MFTKETEYAIRGLVYIKLQNLKNRRPGVEEIAREIEAPHFYIAKILQRLVRSGYLRSLKGKGGGFFIEKSDPDLSLFDVAKALQGTSFLTACGFGLKKCDENNPCPLHEKYAPVRDSMNRLISEETISGIAGKLYVKEPSATPGDNGIPD